jgi:hypothetical protein
LAELAPGSRLRRAVVRGDLAALGVLLVVSGLVAAVAAGRLGAALGLPAALVGVLLVRWARRSRRALLTEVARAHLGFDPGPSPVPWIADDLWRAHNGFDPELDAPGLLVAEVEPGLPAFGRDATGAFTNVILRPVTPEERSLAPVEPVPAGTPVPEPGDADALKAALDATPGRFVAVEPRWPICCGRPATLERDRPDGGRTRALHLPPSPGSVEAGSASGIHGFRCRACGRRYATDPGF